MKEAIRHLLWNHKQAAERFPTFVEPYVAMGEVFDRVGTAEPGAWCLSVGARARARQRQGSRGLSSSYISMGRPSDAEPILVGALENAKKATCRRCQLDVCNLGIVYDMMGSHANAGLLYGRYAYTPQ